MTGQHWARSKPPKRPPRPSKGRRWSKFGAPGDESGLYHYRARAYDPATGAFVQSDPIGFQSGTLSIYNYVVSNPFSFTDPSGLVSTGTYARRSPTDLANSIGGVTYVTVGALNAGAAVVETISTLSIGDFGAGWIDPKDGKSGRFAPTGTGFCSARRHAALQAAVNKWKGVKRACKPIPAIKFGTYAGTIMRVENLRKMRYNSRLAIARATINAACYGGGDAGHQKTVKEAMAAMNKCGQSLIMSELRNEFVQRNFYSR